MTELNDLPMGGANDAFGFQLDEATADRVVLSWTVDERHLQPHGIVHGGVYCTAVEAVGSIGAAIWFGDRGRVVGVVNHTNFLRAVSEGRLVATGTPIHRGGTQQLWLVEITDEQGRPTARGELRVANLANRDAGSAK